MLAAMARTNIGSTMIRGLPAVVVLAAALAGPGRGAMGVEVGGQVAAGAATFTGERHARAADCKCSQHVDTHASTRPAPWEKVHMRDFRGGMLSSASPQCGWGLDISRR